MFRTTTGTGLVAGTIAILPGVLPDALSLAQEWTWVTLAVATVGFIFVTFSSYFRQEKTAEKRSEIQLTCAILAICCLALGGYRSASGLTATATVLPDTARSIAELVGTNERLARMIYNVSVDVATIKGTTDRTEEKVDALTSKARKDLVAQQSRRNHAEIEAHILAVDGQYPEGTGLVLDLDKVDDPKRWIEMKKEDLPAVVSLYLAAVAYRPRDLDFRAVLAGTNGEVMSRTEGVLMRKDDFDFDEAYSDLELDLPVLPGFFAQDNFVICMTALDLETREEILTSSYFQIDNVTDVRVAFGYFGDPVNILPGRTYGKQKSLSHTDIAEGEFCGNALGS